MWLRDYTAQPWIELSTSLREIFHWCHSRCLCFQYQREWHGTRFGCQWVTLRGHRSHSESIFISTIEVSTGRTGGIWIAVRLDEISKTRIHIRSSGLNAWITISNYIIDRLSDRQLIGSLSFPFIPRVSSICDAWISHASPLNLSAIVGVELTLSISEGPIAQHRNAISCESHVSQECILCCASYLLT